MMTAGEMRALIAGLPDTADIHATYVDGSGRTSFAEVSHGNVVPPEGKRPEIPRSVILVVKP